MSDKSRQEKLETVDLPKIHAALQTAIERRERCEIVIKVSDNGGVISVVLSAEKRFI